MEACVGDVDMWMLCNDLKLNDDKTELVVLHAKHRPPPSLGTVQVASAPVLASPFAKNIGVYMDGMLTLHKQITETCKSAFYSIRNISKIRKSLNLDTAKILVHAFVTSKLDHCNSLLYGPPKYEIQRLQHALNSATRLITLSHKFDHITPLLMSLHWLPIEQRIEFKLLLFTYKALMISRPVTSRTC